MAKNSKNKEACISKDNYEAGTMRNQPRPKKVAILVSYVISSPITELLLILLLSTL